MVTSWARTMLILTVNGIAQKEEIIWKNLINLSKKLVFSVIGASFLFFVLIIIIGAILIFPAFLLAPSYPFESFLWNLGVVLFLPLAFTVSILNVSSVFFIVVFKTGFRQALNLSTDFFVNNWTKILGLVIILILIYLVFFVAASSIVFLAGLLIKSIFSLPQSFGIFKFSGMILIAKAVSWFLLWAVLAGLNVFLNSSLLLLFLEIIKPIKGEKLESKITLPVTEHVI